MPLVLLISSTAAVLVILLGCAVIGWNLLSLFGPVSLNDEEEFFYGLGLGLIALSYSVYLVGLLGWLREGIPVIMLGVAVWALITITVRPSGRHVGTMIRAGLSLPGALARGMPRFYLILVCVIVLLSFLGSGVPVHQPDDLHLYSLLPKRFVEAGQIAGWVEPSVCTTLCMLPLGGITLFTFLYGLGGDLSVMVFQFLMGLLAFTGTAVLFKRMVGAEAATIGAIIFVTTPIVVLVFSATRVDLLAAVITTLSFHALYCGIERREKKAIGFFLLGAVFLGFSVGIKPTAVPLVIVVYVSLILFGLLRPWVLRPGLVIIMVVLSLAVALPWLARAWWYTGNPVWPFLNDTLRGLGVSVVSAHGSVLEGYGSEIASPIEVLRLAWRFVYDFSNPPGAGAHMLLVIFFPLIILFWSAGFAVRALAILCVTYFWLLFSISPQGMFRYVMAGIPAMSAVTAFVLVRLNHHFSWARPITSTMVAFSCVVAVLLAVRTNFYRLPYIIGIETREQFLTRMNLTYSVVKRDSVYPNSMLLVQEIVKESGLPPFSSRLRYDSETFSNFKAYYGEEYFTRLREETWAAAKRGDVLFVVTIGSNGRIKLITPEPRGS